MPSVHLGKPTDYTNPSYRRSDHPSFQQKRHTMVVDVQGASNRTVQTESGTLRFENGVAVLPDDSRARDIVQEMNATEASHPNQYALLEKRGTVNVDTVHRYHFGSMPQISGHAARGIKCMYRFCEECNGVASKETTIQEDQGCLPTVDQYLNNYPVG